MENTKKIGEEIIESFKSACENNRVLKTAINELTNKTKKSLNKLNEKVNKTQNT